MYKTLKTETNILKTKSPIGPYSKGFLNLIIETPRFLKVNRIEVTAYVALLIVAGIMRFWNLGSRALHHDESLHAYFSWQLFAGNGYLHNPMMHGPLQFELNAALFYIF